MASLPLASSDGHTWVVIGIDRRDDGHLEVVYSLAPAVHYRALVLPGTDAAAAVSVMGDHLAQLYASQGYI